MASGRSKVLKVNLPIDPMALLVQCNEKVAILKTKPLFKSDENAKILDDCAVNIIEYVKWAQDYDYNDKVQANGYWSIALIANKLTDFALSNDKHVEHLVPVIGLFNRCFKYIKASRDERSAADQKDGKCLQSVIAIVN